MGVTRAQRKNARIWHHLALAHGYNELAKLSDKLGEKIWCRVGRSVAEEELLKLGVKLNMKQSPTVVTLSARPPHILLTEDDVALMRKYLAEYDLAKAVGQ